MSQHKNDNVATKYRFFRRIFQWISFRSNRGEFVTRYDDLIIVIRLLIMLKRIRTIRMILLILEESGH